MFDDVRFAARQFARRPLFALAVVLILGLGVGASTAVFTLINACLLEPLPFPDSGRVVNLWTAWAGGPAGDYRAPLSGPNFVDVKEGATSFSSLAALRPTGLNLSGGAAPEYVTGARVTTDFFPLVGVPAALGRTFLADEGGPGRDRVVVLGDALWRRRFGADPGALGRAVSIDGVPYEVVGVMPPSFRFATDFASTVPTELWLPAVVDPAQPRGTFAWHVLGKLRPGASLETAGAELGALAGRLGAAYPETNAGVTFRLAALRDAAAARVKPSLEPLAAATALLLVIASANAALLLLARAASREGEAAVRAALGASRGRLVRQFSAEAALLALAAALVGFALAGLGAEALGATFPDSAAALRRARPDARVLGFALLVASAAGLGAALVPALGASQARPRGLVGAGAARATPGRARRRLQAGLLVAEIGLSTVLLASAVAVARGVYATLSRPLGFRSESALTFHVRLPNGRYPDAASARAFYEAAREALRELPAVESVGTADYLPLTGSSSRGNLRVEGEPAWAGDDGPWVTYQLVGGDYFGAMGVTMRRGRPLDDADREGRAKVAVVSESFAARYLPGRDPIGARLGVGGSAEGGDLYEVVGVADDVRFTPWAAGASPSLYLPQRQEGRADVLRRGSFVVRTSGDPGALAGAARAAIGRLDADLPLADVKTYGERVRDAVNDRRVTLAVVVSFAGSALLLTALGLFGLVSYQTRRRARELAIRMALGAASADVGRLVVRDTARLLLAGLALGLPAAFAAGKLLAARLEGVPPPGPLALGGASLLLGAVALLAVLAPARRAARTPLALVLRDE